MKRKFKLICLQAKSPAAAVAILRRKRKLRFNRAPDEVTSASKIYGHTHMSHCELMSEHK